MRALTTTSTLHLLKSDKSHNEAERNGILDCAKHGRNVYCARSVVAAFAVLICHRAPPSFSNTGGEVPACPRQMVDHRQLALSIAASAT